MNSLNEIGLLDESSVKLVQDQYKKNKDLNHGEVKKMEEIVNRSKQKSITNTKQKINGRTYPGRNQAVISFREKASIIIIAAVIVGLTHVGQEINKKMDYDAAVYQITKQELDLSEQMKFEDYKEESKSLLGDIKESIEVLSQISDKEQELRESGDYKWPLFNNDIYNDAIYEVAQENTKEEIQDMREQLDGGKNYGKQ